MKLKASQLNRPFIRVSNTNTLITSTLSLRLPSFGGGKRQRFAAGGEVEAISFLDCFAPFGRSQ
jgi:hypothetical protein